ncbi:unnamed protein product [Cylindrotheca closterium]|uniref:Transmembrane protein n=1 Tax=Cylindrotheca closterium TaxID=2856 RepID=A0AAD2FG29_9STRA|nr:unnamed protein product [Cylindrotheca closterium]
MVDPGEDFEGYMEGMARVESERESTRDLLERHEEWRQTTWAGWTVRQMQSFVRNIEPTVSKIASTFGDSDSASSAVMVNMIRFVALLVVLVTIYVVAQVVQKFVGNELVIEEEIVIVHEYETEEEAAKARKKEFRGKKDKGNKRL